MIFKMKLDSVTEFIRPPMKQGEPSVRGYSMTFRDTNNDVALGTFAILTLDSNAKEDRNRFVVGKIYDMEIT